MITRAIERAYQVLRERNWDTVYWAVDLHGTVLKSNYETGQYEFVNQAAKLALQYLCRLPETKLIFWSSLHDHDWRGVQHFFEEHGIRVDYINENPEVSDTETGNFSQKFYFSILVDDKAGFSPDDWTAVAKTVERHTMQRLRFYR